MFRFYKVNLTQILMIPFLVYACVFGLRTGENAASTVGAVTSDLLCQSPCFILPLGDSITQGKPGEISYRNALWNLLQDAEYHVDFVGSHTTYYGGEPEEPLYDVNHEGHWGWRADEIIEGRASADDSGTGKLTDWLTNYTPDIALIHLGTNDVWAGQDTESTVSELETIIDILRTDNANVTILLAKLIPIDDTSVQLGIAALNGEIDGIASRKTTETSPVLVVDQSLDFDPVTDTYDGVHPNANGRQKMATRWMAGLERVLPEEPIDNSGMNLYLSILYKQR